MCVNKELFFFFNYFLIQINRSHTQCMCWARLLLQFIKAGGFAVERRAPQSRRSAAALAPAAEIAGPVQALGVLWSVCSDEETLINILGSLFLHTSDKCIETQEKSVGEFTIFSSFSTCWVLALGCRWLGQAALGHPSMYRSTGT